MDKKEVKKIILVHFNLLLREKEFKKIKETLFVKISDKNVLQIINFDFGSIGFTCSIALQPLYIIEQSKGINLTMGERLSRFKVLQKEWWSYDNPIYGINEIENLLVANGFPWLEENSTSDRIIEFIQKKKYIELGLVGFSLFHQKKNLGFSLLYSGRIEEGIKCLHELISEISDNATDFMLLYKVEIEKFILKVEKQPELLPEIFENVVEDNKRSLKL